MAKVQYSIKTYERDGNFSIDDSMLGFVFKNNGVAPVYLNGWLLQAYDTLDTRMENEQDSTNWQIIFKPDSGVQKLDILIKSKK